MRDQVLLGGLAWLVLGASSVSVAWAVCCKYNYSWPASSPPGEGGGGPYGNPCEGSQTAVCESSSDDTDLGLLKTNQTRPAVCEEYTLGFGYNFVKHSCDDVPVPGAQWIGDLGGGICCWIVGPGLVTPSFTWNQSFHVVNCNSFCDETGGN